MNGYKEYKGSNGESIFVILNDNDNDILEAQKQITSNGYIIIMVGRLLVGMENTPVIKARKAKEEWRNPAYE